MATTKTEARAFALMDYLLQEPRNRDQIMWKFYWSEGTFKDVLHYLRHNICPEVGAIIPRPTHEDNYCYHLLDAEHPDRPAFWAGTAAATGDVDARLRSILRDVTTYCHLVDGRTVEGRKVKLIEQRVRHLVEDLDLMEEINTQLEPASA